MYIYKKLNEVYEIEDLDEIVKDQFKGSLEALIDLGMFPINLEQAEVRVTRSTGSSTLNFTYSSNYDKSISDPFDLVEQGFVMSIKYEREEVTRAY
jgi:hypothetical protein